MIFLNVIIEGLTDEEIDILYLFVKNKYINITSPIVLQNLWLKYSGIYDITDLMAKLNKLSEMQYISPSVIQGGQSGYGILNVSTYQKLSNIFKYYLFRDKIFQFLKNSWEFLWSHFIITILTSIITAYLYIRLFGSPPH